MNEPDVFGDAKHRFEMRGERESVTGGLLETECPGCRHDVYALIIDGADPHFIDLMCPRDICGTEWTEMA